MIKIIKGDPPQELVDASDALISSLKALYNESPQDYLSGTKKFEFTSAYKSPKVNNKIVVLQKTKIPS